MTEEKSAIINAGGLWKQESNNGEDYLSGSMGGIRILVFKNTKKEPGSNQPDYRLCFAENRKRPEPEGEQTPTGGSDDVPF